MSVVGEIGAIFETILTAKDVAILAGRLCSGAVNYCREEETPEHKERLDVFVGVLNEINLNGVWLKKIESAMLQRSMSDPTDQQLLAINVEQCNGALINMANELQTLKDRNKGVWEKYFSKAAADETGIDKARNVLQRTRSAFDSIILAEMYEASLNNLTKIDEKENKYVKWWLSEFKAESAKIKLNDFRRAYMVKFGKFMTEEQLDVFWETIDANQDGDITMDEFLVALLRENGSLISMFERKYDNGFDLEANVEEKVILKSTFSFALLGFQGHGKSTFIDGLMRYTNDLRDIGVDPKESLLKPNETHEEYKARIAGITQRDETAGEVRTTPYNKSTKRPVRWSFDCPDINSTIRFLDTVGRDVSNISSNTTVRSIHTLSNENGRGPDVLLVCISLAPHQSSEVLTSVKAHNELARCIDKLNKKMGTRLIELNRVLVVFTKANLLIEKLEKDYGKHIMPTELDDYLANYVLSIRNALKKVTKYALKIDQIEFVYAGWVKTPFLFACHKNSWRLDAWEKMAEALPKVDVVTFMNMLRPVKGESAAESQKRIGKLVESLEHKSLSDTERPKYAQVMRFWSKMKDFVSLSRN